MEAEYLSKRRASAGYEIAPRDAGAKRKRDDARMSATTPDAAVPIIAATEAPNVFHPSATVPRKASVVTTGSVKPREKMSCFITFIPRETAVQIRYKMTPGIAHRSTESTLIICGLRLSLSPAKRTTKIETAAMIVLWPT